MNLILQKQKMLMQMAVATLDSVQSVKNMFGNVDPEWEKQKVDELAREYAELCKSIVQSMAGDLQEELVKQPIKREVAHV